VHAVPYVQQAQQGKGLVVQVQHKGGVCQHQVAQSKRSPGHTYKQTHEYFSTSANTKNYTSRYVVGRVSQSGRCMVQAAAEQCFCHPPLRAAKRRSPHDQRGGCLESQHWRQAGRRAGGQAGKHAGRQAGRQANT
jgi:hypothetical protein